MESTVPTSTPSAQRTTDREPRTNTGRTLVMTATYNEIDNLPRLVAEVLQVAPQVDFLVVDDNSPDGTGAGATSSRRLISGSAVCTAAANWAWARPLLRA